MKNLLIATAAAAAMLTAASGANAASGFADLSYTSVDDHEADAVSLGGSVLLPAGGLNVQLDGSISGVEIGHDEDEGVSLAAHLFTRNDSWALGGFASYVSRDLFKSEAKYEDLFVIGIEAAKYYDSVTLSGRVADLIEDDGAFNGEDVITADINVKYFATDNFSLGATYFYADSDDFDGNVDGWGLDGELKLNNPISLTASYLKSEDINAEVWQVGLRWNFGTETLKQRDREGASMGAANRLLSLF